MQPVMMHITVGNGMMWRYVMPEPEQHEGTIGIQLKWFTTAQLEAATDICIEYGVDDDYFRQKLHYIRTESDISLFEAVGEAVLLGQGRVFTMDHNFPLQMLAVDASRKEEYIQQAMNYNMVEKNRLGHRIRVAIPQEPAESRTVLRFMLELDNKLDMILSILQKKEQDSGYQTLQGLALSTVGFVFHDESDIADGALMYSANTLGDGEERFSFAALMEINKIRPAQTGFFYNASMIGVKNDVVDSIVKYLFAKEREMMRNVKELWEEIC